MKALGWVVLLAVVIGGGYYLMGGQQENMNVEGGSENQEVFSGRGEVTFSFTDETAEISNVSEVHMKVDKIEMQSTTGAWVTVDSKDVEYRLMDLKARGESEIYATAKVAANNYNKVRVKVKEVIVEEKNGAKEKAVMPSTTMSIDVMVKVRDESSASVNLDVLADQSLHVTTEGEYVFAPVVKVESRSNAVVETSSTGVVTISGGSVETSATVGMDIDGSVKSGFKLDSSVQLDLKGGIVGIVGAASTEAALEAEVDDLGADIDAMLEEDLDVDLGL